MRRSTLTLTLLGAAVAIATITPPAAHARSGWSELPAASVGSGIDNELLALDCAKERCTGIGLMGGSPDSGYPTIATLAPGATSVTTRRIPGTARGTEAAEISCPKPRWCMIVGSIHTNRPSDRTWAVVRHRTGWTSTRTPSPSNGARSQAYLTGVSCTSTSKCVAVGHYFDSSSMLHGLLLRWNGDRWRSLSTPLIDDKFLDAIDCPSPRVCVIAADRGAANQFLRLSGRTLTKVPGTSAGSEEYSQVNCVSTRWCAASGGTPGQSLPAITSITPRRWQIHRVRTAVEAEAFTDLSCSAVRRCQALGARIGSDGYYHPSVVRWRGGGTGSLTPLTTGNDIVGQSEAIACTTTRCVAVGQDYQRSSGSFLLQNRAWLQIR